MAGRTLVKAGLALVVVAAAAAGYWFLSSESEPKPAQAQEKAAPAGGQGGGVPVEAVEVSVENVTVEVTAVGSLRANESVVVRPETSGRVSEIGFEEGDAVAKDTPLVKLDAEVLRAQLAEAEAALELSRANYSRTKQLFERKTASASLRDETFARMRQDEASVALARANLNKMTILAPFDGVIGLRSISRGAYLSSGDPIATLVDVDPIKVDFSIPEVFAADIGEGLDIRVTVDALPGRTFDGHVYAISPQIDETGRAIVMRATVPNTDGPLRPGMFARVTLIIGERPSAVLVPEEAVFPIGQDQFVYRVVDGKVAQVPVRLGIRRGGKVEIREGLAPGDVVVTAGHLKIRDGAAVTVIGASAGT